MSRRGAVLPMVLALMLALTALAAGTLRVTLGDLAASRGTRWADQALHAAEAGTEQILGTWRQGPWPDLAPGDTARGEWMEFGPGGRARGFVERVDDGSDAPLFRIVVEGRSAREGGARRTVVTAVTSGGAGGPALDAALLVGGRLQVGGDRDDDDSWGGTWGDGLAGGERCDDDRGRGREEEDDDDDRDCDDDGPARGWRVGRDDDGELAAISGLDGVPAGWRRVCGAASDDVAGIRSASRSDIRLHRDAVIRGRPAVAAHGAIDDAAIEAVLGGSWDALVGAADVTLRGNSRIRREIAPRVRRGRCDAGDDLNWGDPEDPSSPCWDRLPVIHAEGDLRIDGGGIGQGILLVEGDLSMTEDMRFYGLVVVRGRLDLRDEATLVGGGVVAGGRTGTRTSHIRDASRILYSSCVLARHSTGSGGVAPLPGRHWFEYP